MVTGIEATGLVLAILPLIINQLDNYVQGVETIKSFRTRRYRRYVDEHVAILGGQHAILVNCLETILEDVVSEDQISGLLADAQHPLWAETTLHDHLQQRLGRDYAPFCNIMSQVSHILEELASKMGLSLDASSIQGQSVLTLRGLHKFKDILSKSKYKELFDSLNNLNDIMRTLVDQSVTRGTRQRLKIRSKESTRRYRISRQTTASLYETVMNKAYWQCSCLDTHSIHFVLDEDIDVCDRMELNRRRLVLMTSPTTTDFSKWQEIEAQTTQAYLRNNISSPPTVTRLRSSRFASSPVSSIASAIPSTSTDHPSFSEISNICHAVQQGIISNGHGMPVGRISDGHYIHDFQVLKTDAGNLEMHSLEDLLFASLSVSENSRTPLVFPKRERRFLAAKLASTVLECQGNWLPSRWSSGNIIFTENITSANLEKKIRTPIIARSISGSTEFKGYPLTWTGHNDLLFPLGLALIELSLCRPIIYLHNPDDEGQSETSMLFEKARSWVYDVSCESGPNYGDVVQQCLFWTKTRDVDMASEEFQAAVFQFIIKPLVEEFNHFNDP